MFIVCLGSWSAVVSDASQSVNPDALTSPRLDKSLLRSLTGAGHPRY